MSLSDSAVMPTQYFIDFDHTISRIDVWDTLIKTAAPDRWQTIIQAYIQGTISSRECNLELARTISMPKYEAENLVRKIGIDPTFPDFVKWTKQQESKMLIVSDGYDFYIKILLEQAGLNDIPYFSNRIQWTNNGIRVEFPLYRKECERDMAHCKCQHILEAHGVRRVYIGDGISDTCAASKCDWVYAKRYLLDYCRRNQINHHPFDDFQDIIRHESEWLTQRREDAQASIT